MPDLAVRARGLSKTYVIRHNEGRPTTAAEAVMTRLRHPLRRTTRERFAALSGLDFDVHGGEVLGVIGRNGAGKSTLLKVLSRITPPSEGQVDVWGRIGSLLEVGTGFHPELTGRENIYLNGAVLGMRDREVRQRFDEIVDFAGVEKFLDTPVKRYSSGMYIRLAFAVAAHLDADVLLVDEVLAVGDIEFQNKCLGKMRDVAAGGRAVLFVSHQMNAVAALCTRAMVLDQGRIAFEGAVPDAIASYQESFARRDSEQAVDSGRPGTGEARITDVRPDKPVFRPEELKTLLFSVDVLRPSAERFAVSATIVNELGIGLVECDMRYAGLSVAADAGGRQGYRLTISSPWLQPGMYRVDMKLHRLGPWVDVYDGATQFEVLDILPFAHAAPADAGAAGVVLGDFTVEGVDR